VTFCGGVFHSRTAATGKARSPLVEKRVRRTTSDDVDAELYLTCRDNTVTCASRVSTSIKEIDQWMAANCLAMNLAKTDV